MLQKNKGNKINKKALTMNSKSIGPKKLKLLMPSQKRLELLSKNLLQVKKLEKSQKMNEHKYCLSVFEAEKINQYCKRSLINCINF